MFLFGGPNIRKMAEENDINGLADALNDGSPQVRLEAGEALARLNDERGWNYLLEAILDPTDPLIQSATAEMLAGLGDPRAVPALREASLRAHGEAAEVIEEALEALGETPEEREMEPDASVLDAMVPPVAGSGMAMLGDFDRPGHATAMDTGQIEVSTAETHLKHAIQLREGELQERGLVETRLAAWLRPDWAEAWYMRGVLLEDLEREREALLAYQAALRLDPNHVDAREACNELQEALGQPGAQPIDQDVTQNLKNLLTVARWQDRRDALAALQPGQDIPEELLVSMLQDEEREVRHAAIEAITRLHITQAAPDLLAERESSWLLRFAILDALAELGALDELVARLREEWEAMPPRNLVITSSRDPLAEMENDQLFEIGLLALDRTGDLEGLLKLVEDFAWEEVDDSQPAQEELEAALDDVLDGAYEEDEDEEEIEEDLLSYVDETGLIIAQALDRLATRLLPSLNAQLLQRLAHTPDLTLLDPTNEEAGPVMVHDLSSLRAAAADELTRR